MFSSNIIRKLNCTKYFCNSGRGRGAISKPWQNAMKAFKSRVYKKRRVEHPSEIFLMLVIQFKMRTRRHQGSVYVCVCGGGGGGGEKKTRQNFKNKKKKKKVKKIKKQTN